MYPFLWDPAECFQCYQNPLCLAYSAPPLLRPIFFYSDGKEQVVICGVKGALFGSENIFVWSFTATSICFIFPGFIYLLLFFLERQKLQQV